MNVMNLLSVLSGTTTVDSGTKMGTSMGQSMTADFSELLAGLLDSQPKDDDVQDDNAALMPLAYMLLSQIQANQTNLEQSSADQPSGEADFPMQSISELNSLLNSSTMNDQLQSILKQLGLTQNDSLMNDVSVEQLIQGLQLHQFPLQSEEKPVGMEMLLKLLIDKNSESNELTETGVVSPQTSKEMSLKASRLPLPVALQGITEKPAESPDTIQKQHTGLIVSTMQTDATQMGKDTSDNADSSFQSSANGKDGVGQLVSNPLMQQTTFGQILHQKTQNLNWNSDHIQEEMKNLIVNHMNMAKSGLGTTEAHITLFPEHLGQVDVKITSHHGIITAHLIADTGVGKDLLESQISQLRQNLSNQGISVEKIEVSQGSGAGLSQFSQDSRRNQQQWFGGKSPEKKQQMKSISAYEANAIEPDMSYTTNRSPYSYSSVEYSA